MSPFLFRCNCQPKVGTSSEERSWRAGKCRRHRYWHGKVWTAGLLYKRMEKGKTWQAVRDTVGSDCATHITPRVSITISIRNMASCTPEQTCHRQLMCFRSTRQLVTLGPKQWDDAAESKFYLNNLGPKKITKCVPMFHFQPLDGFCVLCYTDVTV